jgi:FAD-dependent oxidoreductase domain-containing protein 1
MFLSV